MNKRVSQALTLVALAEAEDKKSPAPPKVIIEGARVYSLKKSGEAKKLHGNVTLSQGTGVALTQSGQNIQVATNASGIDHGALTGLGDDDHTQYVPVDGVARQLADAGYPNALLRSGERTMTGDLQFDKTVNRGIYWDANNFVRYRLWGANDALQLSSTDIILSGSTLRGYMNFDIQGQSNFSSYFMMLGTSDATASFYAMNRIVFRAFDPTDAIIECARLYGKQMAAGLQCLEISRAGDITMLTDKMIQLSNETAAPACNAANRGKIRFVHGGAGVADVEQRCMKSAAGTYGWVQVAIG